MKAERWQQVNDLFQAAVECKPGERVTFLDSACRDDKDLRRQLDSLLASYTRAQNFIESPAFEVAPELLTNRTTDALVGKSISHYRIESLLGSGGMGEVYLARDEQLGRKVALKLLAEHLTTDKAQLGRFKTEARAASALNHPNILTVYEIGAEGERQFMATEFIEGITLRASLAKSRMKLQDALELAGQVASALVAAHEAGVVHRDIKPENIMLRPDGYVKVLDFGIAKLTERQPAPDLLGIGTTTILQTQPGLVLGTVHYMSPEQARGQSLDARTDIWSLGVIMYEMLGGVAPFSGETPSDCIASILTQEPPSLSGVLPDVPVKLQAIIERALRKNSDERYQTTKEMFADLRDLRRELEVESSRPRPKKTAAHGVGKTKHPKARKRSLRGTSVLNVREELRRFRRGVKQWAIALTMLVFTGIGLAIWQLRGVPELNSMLAQGVIRYPKADVEARALQDGEESAATQQEIYAKLGQELHVDPKLLRERLPHVARKLTHAPNASVYEQASANYVIKSYDEAERLALEAANQAQEAQPSDRKKVIDALELAGLSAQRAIQYRRAMQHFEAAEKFTDQTENLKGWVTVQHDLADLLVVWGKYGDAEKRLRSVISVSTAALGAEHPDTLDSRHRLIYPLTRQTKYQEAEAEAREVLKLREKVLGPENVDTIVSRYNLADTLADRGALAEAEALYREVIRLDEKLLGVEHPRTLAARVSLATVLSDQGKNVEAEPLFREVIKIEEEIYGREHPTTLNNRQNLATALQAEGKYEAAEAEYREIIELQMKSIGPEHPDLLIVRNNLAQLLDDEQRFAAAESECRGIIEIEERVLGRENRITLNTRGNLVIALIGQAKFPDAKIEYDEVLSLMERILGLDHPETHDFTFRISTALSGRGRIPEAIEIATRAAEHAVQALGSNHPFTQKYTQLAQELSAKH